MKKSLVCLALTTMFIFSACSIDPSVTIVEQDGVFSNTVENLPIVKETEKVVLQDGDIFNLEAKMVKKIIQGKEVKMLAYNGSIPGPTLEVVQNSTITINFTNNTDVPTTLHSHGIRLKNEFDGVPDVTQDPIEVGESFTYELTFPDPGVYWYHPHIREDYAQELGLYGNFNVVPSDENYWNAVDKEEFVFLDDIAMDNKSILPFDTEITDHSLMGRFGNVLLTSGQEEYHLDVNKGNTVRFYFTNSANTRTFNVWIPGLMMKKVGADSGKYEEEEMVESVIIAPSERTVVEVYFPENKMYMLHHQTPSKQYMLGIIDVKSITNLVEDDDSFNNLHENKDIMSELEAFQEYYNAPTDKSLELNIDMMGMSEIYTMDHSQMGHDMGSENMGSMMGDMDHSMHMGSSSDEGASSNIEWEDDMQMMNSMSNERNTEWKLVDTNTGKANMDIDWKFQVGDKVKMKINNNPDSMHPMQHPIHIHGQRFLVLSINGEKNENLVWKDTVLIPTGDEVEILVDMTNPGTWMVHCHIAEHLHSGMMFQFIVSE